MVLFHTLVIAFGWGIGINPPIDIHVPSPEEITKELEREEKKENPKPDIN